MYFQIFMGYSRQPIPYMHYGLDFPGCEYRRYIFLFVIFIPMDKGIKVQKILSEMNKYISLQIQV